MGQAVICSGTSTTYAQLFSPPVASAPTNLTAVQEGLTSIKVSWSPSEDATGYRIDYNSSSGTSSSVHINDSSTDNNTLSNLQNGDTYTISIVATSQHLPSESVTMHVGLGKKQYIMLYNMYLMKSSAVAILQCRHVCYSVVVLILFTAVPGQPSVGVDSTTTTSISLSWSVPSGSVVNSYKVVWTSDECPDYVDENRTTLNGVDEAITSYIIEGLREGTNYTITVSAINAAGTSSSDSVAGETEELSNSMTIKSVL